MVVLKYRNPKKAIFWSWNSPVGWLPDARSKGTGFDSRSYRGHFFILLEMCLGVLWEYFRTVGARKKCRKPGSKHVKIRIFKNVWEDVSCIREPVTSLFKLIYPSPSSVSQLPELIQNNLIRSDIFVSAKVN